MSNVAVSGLNLDRVFSDIIHKLPLSSSIEESTQSEVSPVCWLYDLNDNLSEVGCVEIILFIPPPKVEMNVSFFRLVYI